MTSSRPGRPAGCDPQRPSATFWGGTGIRHLRSQQVEVVILNQGDDTTFEEELAQDVLEIITVFSARLYGSRSRKNQKLREGVKHAVEEVSS